LLSHRSLFVVPQKPLFRPPASVMMETSTDSPPSSGRKKRPTVLSSSLSNRMKKARSRVAIAFEKMSSPRGEKDHDETVFGKPLAEVMLEQRLRLLKSPRSIAAMGGFSPAVPFIVSACIHFLRTHGGTKMEGIFRVSGFHGAILKLKQFFNQGGAASTNFDEVDEQLGCHEVAGVLKLFLREMPSPLLTYELYPLLLTLAEEADKEPDAKAEEANKLLEQLPDDHCHLLRQLLEFLNEISSHSQENCMGPHNLATVIGPALMWPPSNASGTEGAGSLIQLQEVNSAIKAVELLILYLPVLTSLERSVAPSPSAVDLDTPRTLEESQELSTSDNRGLLQRLKRVSRSFHESPLKRRRQEDYIPEEWERDLVDEEIKVGTDVCQEFAGMDTFQDKRLFLSVEDNLCQMSREISKEKVVCAASSSLDSIGELYQVSPSTPVVSVDKENMDNLLSLNSPYRPSKNQSSPHPKKFARASLTVVRVRTKKGRTGAEDAFSILPSSTSALSVRPPAQ